ncbi:M13 family metallopeptidase [Ruania halotolerans]|uniref:M13 family metallopeptidase n=1 Tax=Ruania halotolerans TaxID=2897773 RepID=UPI001E2C056F|nr:M13-type metalloendopeptidase [Ruania halotolerans]UFU05301.1 peptidase M13 [Ruania halotolerans]
MSTIADADTAAMDPAVRPQDDLFRYVNGAWLASHEIPADRGRDGTFHQLHDKAEAQVRTLITEAADVPADDPAGPEAAKIAAVYASFMATERVDALGTLPLAADLELVTAAHTTDQLARALGSLQRTGIGGAVAPFVDVDSDDPTRYIVYLEQSGLGMPDEAYYRESEHAGVRAAYVPHVAAMLALAGVVTEAEAHGAAERVMALETRLAGGHWDRVRCRDAHATYNQLTLDELVELAPAFDWRGWSASLGAPHGALAQVVVRQPDYLAEFSRAWESEKVDTWRLWLTWRVIRGRAPYLSSKIVEENFDFVGRTLTGAQEIRERWKRGVTLVEGVLGEAVGKLYVARHFPPSHKGAMDVLVADLVEAYRRSISTLDWMSPQTRELALEKLAAFTPKVGYPAKWRDYSGLEVSDDDLLGNVRAAQAFETDYELNKLGGPIDRDEWFMSPQTVNAYYNPSMNEIVFPAAILQPPFFDADADDATNYGAIGAVIGHELGHGFDDQGSRYDGTGRLRDWWTESDRAEFETRTKALIAQYDVLSPAQLDDSHTVNGALTVGENIGDLGGLGIGIQAFRIAKERRGEDVTTEEMQRLFVAWARCWRTKARDEETLRLLSIDPHSPDEIRCNATVRNLDEFVAAFDVQPGDGLWLDPDERVRIW